VLDRAGVLDSTARWDVSVSDSGVVGFASSCPANADCARPPTTPAIVTSRSVTFHPRLDGVVVDGLQWSVEIGDRGSVLGASGPLGAFTAVGSYPLRSVDRAFADLQAAELGWTGEPTPLPNMGIVSPAGGSIPTVTVEIDDVTVAWAVLEGRADGRDGTFVVPTYRFGGHDASEPSVTADEPALDPSFVSTAPVVPTTGGIKSGVPTPAPAPDAAPPQAPDSTAAPIVPRPLGTVPAHSLTP
jgi:hypothetical protein